MIFKHKGMDRSHVVTDTTIPQTAQIIDNIVIWQAAGDMCVLFLVTIKPGETKLYDEIRQVKL